MNVSLRDLPSVHELLASASLKDIMNQKKVPGILAKEWVQSELENLRQEIVAGEFEAEKLSREFFTEILVNKFHYKAKNYQPYRLRKVINATGTVLHTNLGRARLSERAIQQVVETSTNYSNLEYELESGKRGSRHDIIEGLLVKASGAEAAMVVNNNAAAVYLVLRSLVKGFEAVVSRGELVEIGGSFRISTIMEESDATLREVGTTNKTHPYDYEDAINEQTKMFMKVHTSNFKTVGFTKSVSTKELRQIRDKHEDNDIIIYEDLGSGSLFPFSEHGIGEEPIVRDSLRQGADIISFSGDKLLGGPQAGIIAGKADYIARLKKHPLARVLRVDKMTLAALEATLFDYVYGAEQQQHIPALRDILRSKVEITTQVHSFIEQMEDKLVNISLTGVEDHSQVGGGTMPVEELASYGLLVKKRKTSANECEILLRKASTPIISRMKDGQVFLDFRTISSADEAIIEQVLITLDKKL
ncbi:L-seryl-tRNA(Sec) selenium transferase [Salipaludibacillus neizhouensis]|uniref:L-seryl-tRNA(Sec) selenium transferase n=1 Tax=Salipaludibacillus neizhouensis TaxID=885475 RepID=A0A3A9KF22_9BACI|nr:L-seryl-tRNA(Sec) selenium transferase [Salipaludibacillus neizhouensis]RKL69162.1 L-seryl-tRNA(Sec) selenium transferase [Salipaludibacillus neizhouensis]